MIEIDVARRRVIDFAKQENKNIFKMIEEGIYKNSGSGECSYTFLYSDLRKLLRKDITEQEIKWIKVFIKKHGYDYKPIKVDNIEYRNNSEFINKVEVGLTISWSA